MKRILTLIVAVSALFLAGCATSTDNYYTTIKEIEKSRADAQAVQATAIMSLAQQGDAQAKGMALMYFALQGSKSTSQNMMIAPPKDSIDRLFQAGDLVLRGLGLHYGYAINKATIAADESRYGLTLGTIGGLASEGMSYASKPPLIVQPTFAMPIPTATPAE